MTAQSLPSTNSEIVGRTEPRLWTPPLRELRPCGDDCRHPLGICFATSYGYAVIEFARDVANQPLDPWQEWVAIHLGELLEDGRPRFRKFLILVARQNGKALDVDTPMLTTHGWSTMGALKAGDEVFHPDGHPTRVIGAYDVMHDHRCYRVTTTDGRSIVADADHLWTVQDRRLCTLKGRRGERPVRTYEWETLTTEQLVERGLHRAVRQNASGGTSTDYAFRLPRQHTIVSESVALPIDPYLLGAWLGDGTSVDAALAVGDQDIDEMTALLQDAGARIVSKSRERTAWRVQFSLDERRRKVSTFRTAAMELGVWGNKHVPDVYLTSGVKQRLALLQGLLDTDGSIHRTSGQVEFCATRKPLADAVLHLARSLGWRATIQEGAAILDGREAGSRWRVFFTPVQGDLIPFRLRRKAERVRVSNARGGELYAVSIATIEAVESRPVRCIKVDREDGMFLAGRDLVATHNTELLVVLTLFWLFVDQVAMVLGTSTKLDYAAESWRKACKLARKAPDLDAEIPKKGGIRKANGEQVLWRATPEEAAAEDGSRYKIAASNEEGGRSLTIDRLVLDELRQHHDYSAYDASEPATSAVPDAQIVAISNAGSDKSVVLNDMRAEALHYIKTGEGDSRLGIAEYSAPDGSAPDNIDALAQSNPNMGHRILTEDLLNEAAAAMRIGGKKLAGFKTEKMCMRVPALDNALDLEAWGRKYDPDSDEPGCLDPDTLDKLRDRVTLVLEVAEDQQHATLYAAAALDDGRVRIDPVKAWDGPGCTKELRAELHTLVAKVKPRKFGWFPNGPAAAIAADMGDNPDADWPPNGVTVEEIKSDTPAVCMGFADLVHSGQIAHSGDPLLDAHVAAAEKQYTGSTWKYARQSGHVDATYAAAGATHLARTLPPPVRTRTRFIS